MQQDDTAITLSTPLTEYLSQLAKQDGLYIGLGLGAVCGGLLATRDIKTTLRQAFDLLTLIEQITARLNDPN